MSDHVFVLVLWVCSICVLACIWAWGTWHDARFEQRRRHLGKMEELWERTKN